MVAASTHFMATAQTTVLYQDDFEGTVTGWSDNRTDFDADVTRFLGRFDNNPRNTSRTFNVPANTDYVDIEFDFYRFDSWDNNSQFGFDRFEIIIDGVELFSLPFPNPSPNGQAARSGVTGNVEWGHTPLTGRVELAFNTGQFWFDQLHRFNIRVNNPGATLDLTLRTDINQGGNDESGGYDNITVTAATQPIIPNLIASKTVAAVNGEYSIPGNLVDYTLSLENTGGPVDDGTVVFVDALPDEITLFTGDLDGAGNSVIFSDSSSPPSGLSCCTAANIDYSNSVSAPPTFGYVPASDFDDNIRFIRISPNGVLRDSQTDVANVDFTFRAQIK